MARWIVKEADIRDLEAEFDKDVFIPSEFEGPQVARGSYTGRPPRPLLEDLPDWSDPFQDIPSEDLPVRVSTPPPGGSSDVAKREDEISVPSFPRRGTTPSVVPRLSSLFFSPRTVYGTEAWLRLGGTPRRRFVSPRITIPCLARTIRREVMFARRKAGRGYRTGKRWNEFSYYVCER